MTDIQLHGILGKEVREKYRLDVKSVGEAIHAMNTLSKGKLYRTLKEFDKQNIKYKVLVNNRPLELDRPINLEDKDSILSSEFRAINKNLRNIDIVPVLEGADEGFIQLFLGVVLIVVGLVVPGLGPFGVALVLGGIGLVAGGIISLLTSPPKFADFREIDGATGRTSYLFNGPTNTTQEGGPVPVGYGTLLVGSQVISASYVVADYDSSSNLVPAITTLGPGIGGLGGGGGRGIVFNF